MDRKIDRLHFIYCGIILVGLLVGTLSVQLGPQEKLAAILSFGLGLASLILAIIAIIQSLISSGSFARIIGSFQMTSEKMREAANEISETTTRLATQVENIPKELSAVSSKLDSTKSAIDAMSIGGNANVADRAPAASPATKIDPVQTLNNSSIVGLAAIYGAMLSFNTKRSVDFTKIDAPDRFYMFGYLVALRTVYALGGALKWPNLLVSNLEFSEDAIRTAIAKRMESDKTSKGQREKLELLTTKLDQLVST